MLVRAASLAVLAVHDPGLVRVQTQPATLGQPDPDHVADPLRLLLSFAVDHHVVAVALEPDAGIFPGHPSVERVVHEQVRQQR